MRRAAQFLMTTLAIIFAVGSHSAIAEDFYAGKIISINTHSPPGDGYDIYLRLLTHYMGKYIPGHPGFIILNQPGAGGLYAVNYAGRTAAQDGTFLSLVSEGIVVIAATGGSGLQTSLGAFKWLGNFSQSNNVTVTWATSNIKTLADAMTHDVTVGASGVGSASVLAPTLYNALLGTRFKIIIGYTGSGPIDLAMERGELDGRATATWASIKFTLPAALKEGKLNVLIQMGLRKEPDLPDVPLLSDLVKGDDRKQPIADFMSLAVALARPLAAPPGVPDDRVAILRRAFDATMKDADFLAEAAKQGSDIDPMTGEQTQAAVTRLLATPKPVLASVQAALGGQLH